MKVTSILDETDIAILNHLREGCLPKDIAHKLWKGNGYIHTRLARLRKRFKCYTTDQLRELLQYESVA